MKIKFLTFTQDIIVELGILTFVLAGGAKKCSCNLKKTSTMQLQAQPAVWFWKLKYCHGNVVLQLHVVLLS
jgi:hypothetical protein